jgi:hypothetical protein
MGDDVTDFKKLQEEVSNDGDLMNFTELKSAENSSNSSFFRQLTS